MAAINPNQNGSDVAALLKTEADKYVSLGELLDYQKPDNRDLLINTYGDQGITGFLQLTGATRSGGTNDEVQYWEEGRLHKSVAVTNIAAAAAEANCVVTVADNDPNVVRNNDILLTSNGDRLVVTDADTSGTTFTCRSMSGDAVTADATDQTLPIIGNIYAQGTGQPTSFYQTDVTKRTNPYFITKETYHVTGSAATNIGWINIGNGDYRWYVKGEMDTRKRFMNQREMMMLLSQKWGQALGNDKLDSIALASGRSAGSEGYFDAIEHRGITTTGTFGDGAGFADIDEIIFELDKQGAPSEYAMYVDTKTSLAIDDMLAAGIATQTTAGLPGQFGAFQNSADMAVQLGFKSFSRGSYTFHKHGWKLLSDPTLLNSFNAGEKPYLGAMIPMTQVADAKTGMKAPALEMNYKETNGYSRELEHWVEGGGVLGFKTNDEDLAKFHYRSEACLVTRAANQHVLLKA
tara:strand:+ start:1078 stop:2466 length:1389 start_codon:yes stop_codon:yes gene_type:complete